MESRQLVLWNTIIHYYQSTLLNEKKCFVFLHGWGQWWGTFEKLCKFFDADGHSYICIDLPWFGKSPIKDFNMQVEDYGEIVKQCIEKLWLQKPTLIGHSFWWRISIFLASSYGNIERIVLIGSAGIKKSENPVWLSIVKLGKFFFQLPWLHLFFNTIKNSVVSQDNKNAWAMKQIFLNAIGNDLQKYMEKIRIPTLMIRWENDNATPLEEGKLIHKKIQGSKFFVIEKGTHFVYDEFPNEVYQIIQTIT